MIDWAKDLSKKDKIWVVSNEPIPAYNFKKWHADIKKKLGRNWRKWHVSYHKNYLVFTYPKMPRKKILNYIRAVDHLTKYEGLHLTNCNYR